MKHERAIQAAVEASSLHVLITLVSSILTRSGYGESTVLGRRHKLQKSQIGGCELMFQLNVGSTPLKVIVKIINDFVRTRMLDELAGAVDRTSKDMGILVSTKKLGPRVAKYLELYTKSKIEVIDGVQFADSLDRLHLGVRTDGSVDYSFFAELESQLEHVLEFIYEKSRIPR